jgi:hemoglobin
VRHVFANPSAAAVRQGQPFPYGSVLVMETWRAKLTADNQIDLDANGRYQKDELAGIFVMRKEAGYGAKYGPDRTGEWEYVAYRPDNGQFQTAPERSQACAQCHLAASDAQKDWVIRANLFFAQRLNPLAGVAGLPRTGGHDFLTPLPSLAPFGLAVAGPALMLAGAALRSRRRR